MSQTISQRELRNDSGRIIRELANGQEFLITRSGIVVGHLEPVTSPALIAIEALRRRRGSAARIDLQAMRADLDAIVDPRA